MASAIDDLLAKVAKKLRIEFVQTDTQQVLRFYFGCEPTADLTEPFDKLRSRGFEIILLSTSSYSLNITKTVLDPLETLNAFKADYEALGLEVTVSGAEVLLQPSDQLISDDSDILASLKSLSDGAKTLASRTPLVHSTSTVEVSDGPIV